MKFDIPKDQESNPIVAIVTNIGLPSDCFASDSRGLFPFCGCLLPALHS